MIYFVTDQMNKILDNSTDTIVSSGKEVANKNTIEKIEEIRINEMLKNNEMDVIAPMKNNLENITNNRLYRKKNMKLFSDVVKSNNQSTTEVGKTVIDLKHIQSMLIRDETLNSSKIQSSPPDICTDNSQSVIVLTT